MKHFPIPRAATALVVSILCIAPGYAQKLVKSTPPVVRTKDQMDTALAVPGLRNAMVGVLVRSLDDGRVLYERNADTSLMPASNEKLLTSTAVFSLLTPAFRYKTLLYRTGTISKNGELKGDLILKGSGDPSLDSTKLLTAAQALKNSGVTKFTGRIIADATRFDDQYLGGGWEWDDDPYYYQAQISGLNCDENVMLFEVQPGERIGDPAKVVIGGKDADALGFRSTNYVTITNTAVTVAGPATGETKPAGRVNFDRVRGRNEIRISGSIPLNGAPVRSALTIENPARFTATRLYELLAVAGIEVPPVEKRVIEIGTVPVDATMVQELPSEELNTLLRHFLKQSDNLYGECLLKTLGAEKGTGGTALSGANVIKDFLKQMGVSDAGLVIADGSGLSRRNNVTARLLVDLLTAIDKKWTPELQDAYVKALPEAGLDGTLRSRFKSSPAEGKVHAKTGTLFGVSSLSGYLTTVAGERLVFSILMNHFGSSGRPGDIRGAQDGLVLALMGTPRPGAGKPLTFQAR